MRSRRYELDRGAMPETLDALVPEYLPAVPVDPFDGKPLRYVKAKDLVYAVGEDCIDQGGSTNAPAGKKPTRRSAEDLVVGIHTDMWK